MTKIVIMLRTTTYQTITYLIRDRNIMSKYQLLLGMMTKATPIIRIQADNITEYDQYFYVPNVAGAAYSASYQEHGASIDFQNTTIETKKTNYNHGNDIIINKSLIQSISLTDSV